MKIITVVFVAVAVLLATTIVRRNPPTVYLDLSKIEQSEMFELIQDYRRSVNLPAYQESPLTCEIANQRLMEVKSDWSHTGFYDEVEKCGKRLCHLGENLAEGFKEENKVLEAWLKSASHSANLHRNFPFSCLRTDGNIVVHIFGDL